MKSFLLSLMLAALLVAGWVALRPQGADFIPTPLDPAASFAPESRPATPVSVASPSGFPRLPDPRTAHLDDLHRAHGRVGESMRTIIESTVGWGAIRSSARR
jgi:hypothetical protein